MKDINSRSMLDFDRYKNKMDNAVANDYDSGRSNLEDETKKRGRGHWEWIKDDDSLFGKAKSLGSEYLSKAENLGSSIYNKGVNEMSNSQENDKN